MVLHFEAHYHMLHLGERHQERRAASLEEPHGAAWAGRESCSTASSSDRPGDASAALLRTTVKNWERCNSGGWRWRHRFAAHAACRPAARLHLVWRAVCNCR
mmetsp:Transcript_52116/g.117035  ORF Transcript_52116/g.117035 Transcript_52116/m.117035 type:complete len:102 (-) Transcript_52116:294-599(-)